MKKVTFYDELLNLAIAAINSGEEPISLIHSMDVIRDRLIERMARSTDSPDKPVDGGST